MRIRIAAPALVGALALTALAAPGTAFAASATTLPKITQASAASVSVGLTGTYTVRFSVTAHDAKGIKSIEAEPWKLGLKTVPGLNPPTAQDVAQMSLPMKVVSRTATTETVSYTEVVPATKDRMPDVLAGTWGLAVLVTGKDGRTTFAQNAAGFSVKRADVLTAKATATHLRKGAALSFKGQLKRADWDKNVWSGNAGQSVQLQFKNSHGAWVTKAVAKSTANGAFSISARDYASGSWRVVYGGNAVSGSAVSGSTYVAVK